MICPAGQILSFKGVGKFKRSNLYKAEASVCMACEYFGVCTKSQHGRQVARLVKEDVRKRLEAQFKKPDSQAVYKLRKQTAELPFAHLKKN